MLSWGAQTLALTTFVPTLLGNSLIDDALVTLYIILSPQNQLDYFTAS
jgi:hypothetical protein